MTRMVKVSSTEDLGVFKNLVNLQIVDNKIEAITFTIGQEHEQEYIRIVPGDSYSNSLKILKEEVIQEPRYRVVGNWLDLIEVNEVFKERHEADAYISSFIKKTQCYDCPLVVEEFNVNVSGTRI